VITVDLDLGEIETATPSAVQANKQAIHVAIATYLAEVGATAAALGAIQAQQTLRVNVIQPRTLRIRTVGPRSETG
jgi:hypothetical protein